MHSGIETNESRDSERKDENKSKEGIFHRQEQYAVRKARYAINTIIKITKLFASEVFFPYSFVSPDEVRPESNKSTISRVNAHSHKSCNLKIALIFIVKKNWISYLYLHRYYLISLVCGKARLAYSFCFVFLFIASSNPLKKRAVHAKR